MDPNEALFYSKCDCLPSAFADRKIDKLSALSKGIDILGLVCINSNILFFLDGA
jgi:hypothetical protein